MTFRKAGSLGFFWLPLFKHLKAVIAHKGFVFQAGFRIGVPLWNLLVHDLSKLSPIEAAGYSRHFYGGKDPQAFLSAWHHHTRYNPHHPEYWVASFANKHLGIAVGDPLPMPDQYILEMVADWMGASRSYEGHWPDGTRHWKWLEKNWRDLPLHPKTRLKVLDLLDRFYGDLEYVDGQPELIFMLPDEARLNFNMFSTRIEGEVEV